MDENVLIARMVLDDGRLSRPDKFLLLDVLLSEKPFVFNPIKLRAKHEMGEKFFESAMRKLELFGYITPVHRAGIGFTLSMYKISIADILSNKRKVERAVKKKQVDRTFIPNKIEYQNFTQVKYFDELDVLDEDEEIVMPDVINGVPTDLDL
jgi:hypothetical protein